MLPTARKGSRHGDFHFCRMYAKLVQIPVYGIGGIKIDEAQLHELKMPVLQEVVWMSGMMHI